jgi:hypothetical protein
MPKFRATPPSPQHVKMDLAEEIQFYNSFLSEKKGCVEVIKDPQVVENTDFRLWFMQTLNPLLMIDSQYRHAYMVPCFNNLVPC